MLGAFGLLATLLLALLVGRDASARFSDQIGQGLAETAVQTRDRLDRTLWERWLAVRILADLPVMRDPRASPETKRAILNTVRQVSSNYAWIAFIDASGRVVAATDGLLEHEALGALPWFQAALHAPYVGDVHEMTTATATLAATADAPQRVVDLAHPVRDEAGRPLGVLAAHVHWHYAREIEQAMHDLVRHPSATEILVLSRQGTVWLGSQAQVERPLALPPALQPTADEPVRAALFTWVSLAPEPDPAPLLAADAPTLVQALADLLLSALGQTASAPQITAAIATREGGHEPEDQP
ncbi:cache domain-containing protein [Methylobacterium oryzisoli]|uniref:cache domain-containing protein n=1 Tax=Methylobacterium oryzisoli TaxID=3385502 RepID=UPI003891FDB7